MQKSTFKCFYTYVHFARLAPNIDRKLQTLSYLSLHVSDRTMGSENSWRRHSVVIFLYNIVLLLTAPQQPCGLPLGAVSGHSWGQQSAHRFRQPFAHPLQHHNPQDSEARLRSISHLLQTSHFIILKSQSKQSWLPSMCPTGFACSSTTTIWAPPDADAA